MRHFATATALILALVTAGPALAGSQSSGSSSNCSNGHCTRVDSLFIEDGHFRRGYIHREEWRERNPYRRFDEYRYHGPRPDRHRHRDRRRGRDDDDD